jgi:hypothetical protein
MRAGSLVAQHLVKLIATVFLAGAVIWLIVLRKPTEYLSDERWMEGFTNEMVGDLKGLAGGERRFFEAHKTYATDLRALDSAKWFFSPNVSLVVTADGRGWSATARHRFITTPCTMSAQRAAEGSETAQGPTCSPNAAFTAAWDSARGSRGDRRRSR